MLEQGLGVFQVGGVEALSEPAVDFGEQRARLVGFILLIEQGRRSANGSADLSAPMCLDIELLMEKREPRC